MRYPFVEVDVFSEQPFLGNPVAVVLDADDLNEATMQRIARWTNLSETTFVLTPTESGADYRVRIFTPVAELPFAGHPTLGTCHAWLDHCTTDRADSNRTDVTQQCAAGLIRVRRRGGRLAFAAPPLLRSGPVDPAVQREVLEVAGLDEADVVAVEWADNGPGWIAVLLRDADAVLAARLAFTERFIGLAGPHPTGSPEAIEVRAFFPKDGVLVEDPVTGSLNAALGVILTEHGDVTPPYVAAQGQLLGRVGRIHVEVDDGTVWVGGATSTLVAGQLEA
ncbi:MAG: PhzF family phenazine biosynthesis protein [Ilumatobacteraceae bacterium]